MIVTLGHTSDERRVVGKSFTVLATYEGALRGECSMTAPTIRIQSDIPPRGNYAHILEFSRYYYIADVVSIRTGVWDVSMVCDVLTTYADAIRNAVAVIDATETTGMETYIPGDAWVATAKAKTDIVPFPQGLLSSGEYILITSGGVGGVSDGQ
jgi:hypothetical protein